MDTSDSKRPITAVQTERPLSVIPAHLDVGEAIAFSPDGTKAAFRNLDGGKYSICVNGIPLEPFDFVDMKMVWSPDSKTLCYRAKNREGWVLVMGNDKYYGFDDVSLPVFSGDSKRFAFKVKRGGRWRWVVDGLNQRSYESVTTLQFSNDGRHAMYRGTKDDEAFVIFDGQETGPFDEVDLQLKFSDDGKNPVYWARKKNKWYMRSGETTLKDTGSEKPLKQPDVTNPDTAKLFDEVDSDMVPIPNSTKLAFKARRLDKWYMVVGDRVSEPYDGIFEFTVTAEKAGFGVRKGKELWWKTISCK